MCRHMQKQVIVIMYMYSLEFPLGHKTKTEPSL